MTKIERKDDWRTRLNRQLALADAGLDPNSVNCTLFVDDAVKAMTGTSLLEESGIGRGAPEEQYRNMKKLGHKSVEEAVAASLEEVEGGPALARVGDIAIVETPEGGPAFGVVIGGWIKVLRPDGFPGLVDLMEAKKAFRV